MSIYYKKKLFSELQKHNLFAEEQEDIKTACEKIVKADHGFSENEQYKRFYDLFKESNFNYLNFKINLGAIYGLLIYRNVILKNEDDWMFLRQEKFQATYETLRDMLIKDFGDKDFPNLSEKQKIDIAWEIAEKIGDYVVINGVAGKIKTFYNDILSLSNICDIEIKTPSPQEEKKSQERMTQKADITKIIQKIDKIKIFAHDPKIKPVVITSEAAIAILSERFYRFVMYGGFPIITKINNLNQRIEELNSIKQYLPNIVIRIISNVLIKHNIINEVTTKGNSYGLKNEKGEGLALSNQIAVRIYNMIKTLGLGKQKNDDEEGCSLDDPTGFKKCYVKDRLEASNTDKNKYADNIKSLMSEYQKYLILVYGNK